MNTTSEVALPAVTRSVVVDADPDRAFSVFADSFALWWPAHHINPNGYEGAYVEPRVGGRWYERAPDGSECDWGQVLAWEPPARILLSWHLDGEWAYDPDPDHASQVEVRFVAEAPDRTRVELVHSGLERAAHAARLREGIDDTGGGWGAILRRYADAVDGRELTLPSR